MTSCLLCGKPVISTRNVIKKANITHSSKIFSDALKIIFLEDKKEEVAVRTFSRMHSTSYDIGL
jgi:hypothetical protein